MKNLIFLIILSSLTFSCRKKNIEIDKNGIFIRGGIKSEFVIKKIINNNPNDSISFPYNYYVKEEIRLRIEGKGLSRNYINGERKYTLNGKVTDLKDRIDFNKNNEYYHWTFDKPIDSTKYETMPMIFEKKCWYSIRNIRFRGSDCYFKFYINKKGEFEYNDIGYIVLSPI